MAECQGKTFIRLPGNCGFQQNINIQRLTVFVFQKFTGQVQRGKLNGHSQSGNRIGQRKNLAGGAGMMQLPAPISFMRKHE